MERCRAFLNKKSPASSRRAMDTVRRHYAILQHAPNAGRPLEEGLRELVIPFGDSGYVALYDYVEARDTVRVLAFRHQKEADY